MTLEYKPGKDNPADFLSRHPHTIPKRDNKAENYISYIVSNAVPKSLTLDEIREATALDGKLLKVMDAVKSGRWHESDLTNFAKIANEISVTNGGSLGKEY